MRFRKQDFTELVESMSLDLSAFKVFVEGFDPPEKPNSARWAVVICDNEQSFIASYHISKGVAMYQVMTLRHWLTDLAEAKGIAPETVEKTFNLVRPNGKQNGKIG